MTTKPFYTQKMETNKTLKGQKVLNPRRRKDKHLFIIDRTIKLFHNKQKLKQYMNTKPQLQKILCAKDESKQNHDRMGSIKPQKKRQVTRE
jgi:hypothetical protein